MESLEFESSSNLMKKIFILNYQKPILPSCKFYLSVNKMYQANGSQGDQHWRNPKGTNSVQRNNNHFERFFT